jgi:hypothetical protein
MTTLATCPTCAGFIPPAAALCPHCGAACAAAPPAASLGSKLLAAASTGVMAITLMACYGGGPDPECVDKDGDGAFTCFAGGENDDCDDNNAAIYPGAPDPADDGIDQNCDGVDGPAASTTDASTTAETTTDAATTEATTEATTTG